MEPVNFQLIAEDIEAFTNTSTEGFTDINNQVLIFTTNGLERNTSYNLYLMARTYTVQEWYLVNMWHTGKTMKVT